MEERAFKGVWIPKEIWLNEELTLLEKCIYTEIESLDNDDHCTAGNEYFARFCNCSESKITKAIKKLEDLGMIEVLAFDGRHRKIRVVKNTRQSSKKYEAGSEKVRSINISNNKKDFISKDIKSSPETKTEFDFGAKKQPKASMYDKCVGLIFDFTSYYQLGELLIQSLRQFIENAKESGKPFYTNNFKGKINNLRKLASVSGYVDEQLAIKIVQQTIDRGWNDFYELKLQPTTSRKKAPSTDIGYISERAEKKGTVYEKF